MRIGFDNDKYLKTQSQHIRERIATFDNKLYLEFGGKLFDDYHASRVLPGFAPDSKLQMLMQLADQAEIVMVVSADDIEKNKVNSNLGITYDDDVVRLVDEFRSKQKEAAHAEETATAAEIVAKITEEMRAYLADHDDQKTAVKKLCEKYAKGGNYTTIKEPAIAAKLLDEFRTKFTAAAESADAASKEPAKAKK